MISKLRDLDAHTVIADGPKFDLPKVIETALAILWTLHQRSMMRFPGGAPPTFSFSSEDCERPFDEKSPGQIAYVFDDCKITMYDVTLFCCSVHFGPFMVDLYLLGFDCLHGPMINCLTDHDLSWEHLDPTPVMMLMMRRGMIDPIEDGHMAFLSQVLDGFLPRGIAWEVYETDEAPLAIQISFPHAAFGKGEGPMRICRYLHEVREDGEEEP